MKILVRVVLLSAVVSALLLPFASPAEAALNVYPVAVTSSVNYSSGDNILTYDNSCDSTIDNGGGGEPHSQIVLDYGAIYHVYAVRWHGDVNTYTAHYTVEYSVNGTDWTNIGYDLVGTILGSEHYCGSNHEPQQLDTTQYMRYLRLTEVANNSATFDTVELYYDVPATPTPAPTFATPLPPQPTACVTAMPTATATRQASPTPLIQRTPTPGGATATPGPTATGTPLPSFDSGIATFAQSLQPWTATEHFSFGGLYVTEWQSTNGPDGQPGAAFTKDFVGLLDNPSGPLTTTEPLSGSMTFSRPGGMFFPFRVTGSVKWSASILGGESAYLRVWYYDPDYISPGQGAWVTDPPNWRDQFSSDWGHFSFSLVQHGGSGRVTAVAISEELDGDERSGEGALLDNLRVYSGPQAVAGSFPVCQGSGGTGPRPVETKFCNIKQITADVYATCKAPDNVIDVVGWLAYLYCRLVIYFQFLPQNRQQITDLIARQNADEPFGTFVEVSNITGVIGDMFSAFSSTYGANAVNYRTINWSELFNFRQLDDIQTLLHIPNDPGVVERYRSRCPVLQDDNMNSQLFRNYGCLVIVFTRDQLPFFGAWQWVIDISSIIGLVIYAKSVLFKTAQ